MTTINAASQSQSEQPNHDFIAEALDAAESFIQGFEGDDAQEPGSINRLLWLLGRAQDQHRAFMEHSADLDGASDDDGYDDAYPPACTNPGGHEWGYSGTAYGGDDPSYHGEGRCYCVHCGADGDA